MSSEPTILDGGTGQLLIENGHESVPYNHPMWATGALEVAPELVSRVHEEFAASGAQILFSNTYSLFNISKNENISKSKTLQILKASKEVLDSVCAKYGCKYAVSIGPLAVKYHDCSEYNGNYLKDGRATIQNVETHYRWILDVASKLGETLVACETIPSLAEVQAVLRVIQDFPDIKFFITMRANSATTSAHGDSIQEAAQIVSKCPQVIAFGINCCDPRICLDFAKATHNLIGSHQGLIIKPNNGRVFNLETKTFDGLPYDLLADFDELVSYNTRYIGGCCTVKPGVIQTYCQHLQRRKYYVV